MEKVKVQSVAVRKELNHLWQEWFDSIRTHGKGPDMAVSVADLAERLGKTEQDILSQVLPLDKVYQIDGDIFLDARAVLFFLYRRRNNTGRNLVQWLLDKAKGIKEITTRIAITVE